MKYRNQLKKLIKEEIRKIILQEGFQLTDNMYISMYEDNIILTQSFNGGDSDTGQKIEISMNDFPKVLDGLFNILPISTIPVNYRQSMIAKLSDKAMDQETDLNAEKPDKDFEGGKGKEEADSGSEELPADEEAPEEEK